MASRTKSFLRSGPTRYGFAVLVVGAAVLLRLTMFQLVPLKSPFLLLFAAVVLSAAYGGLGPGILATTAASVASEIFMTGWPDDLQELRSADRAQLGLFFVEGLILSLLGAMFHRARRRAEGADAAARELEQRILEISEEERRRIGHDLHDGLGQHLTGIALLTQALKQRLSSLHLPESQDAARVAELVNESIGWTRDLARGLSPIVLDSGGLAPALEELASSASSHLGIACTCHCNSTEVPLDDETSLHLYRIAQEAINNSVKHGKAKSVAIELTAEDGQITLTVIDNGVGLSEKTRANPGIGLQIMEYRARMIGAVLSLSRVTPSGGTVVSCRVRADRSAEDLKQDAE